MRAKLQHPPRRFAAGFGPRPVEMRDYGRLELDPDEQVTFTTPRGGEYDVARKDWGFYATPSLNGRLRGFGLSGRLVRNRLGREFVLLVEDGCEEAFAGYCASEGLVVLERLDGDGPTCVCGGRAFAPRFTYTEPPAGETRFAWPGQYRRDVVACERCGHLLSLSALDPDALYAGDYVEATYGGDLRAAYDRVLALPPERSDNEGRVARVVELCRARLPERAAPSALDVGAGLCVFLARLAPHGFRCTALDPDPRAAAHARDVVGVEAVCADWRTADRLGRFDLVALNKVLEHVPDPIGFLAKAHEHLAPGGLVYVEVPDGPAAAAEGPHREELFVEHLHVFSTASLAICAARAGFSPVRLERLTEPSGKHTIWAALAAEEASA